MEEGSFFRLISPGGSFRLKDSVPTIEGSDDDAMSESGGLHLFPPSHGDGRLPPSSSGRTAPVDPALPSRPAPSPPRPSSLPPSTLPVSLRPSIGAAHRQPGSRRSTPSLDLLLSSPSLDRHRGSPIDPQPALHRRPPSSARAPRPRSARSDPHPPD